MERVELPMEPVEPRIASFFTKVIFSEVRSVLRCLSGVLLEWTAPPTLFLIKYLESGT